MCHSTCFRRSLLLGLVLCLSPRPARGTDCVDYLGYLQRIGAVSLPPGIPGDMAVDGEHAYFAQYFDHFGRFTVFDLSDPQLPTFVSYVDTPDSVYRVAASGQYACLINDFGGFYVIDVSNPWIVGTHAIFASAVSMAGNYVYTGETNLAVWDISDPLP